MEKNNKKPFFDPKMTKCEKPLDKVTMGLGFYRPNDRPRPPRPWQPE